MKYLKQFFKRKRHKEIEFCFVFVNVVYQLKLCFSIIGNRLLDMSFLGKHQWLMDEFSLMKIM